MGKRKPGSITHLLTMSLHSLLRHFALARHHQVTSLGLTKSYQKLETSHPKMVGDLIPLLDASYTFAGFARIGLERSAFVIYIHHSLLDETLLNHPLQQLAFVLVHTKCL